MTTQEARLVSNNDLAENGASESVFNLIRVYELTWHEHGSLDGGSDLVFAMWKFDADVVPPTELPWITHEDKIYFLLPADVELPEIWSRQTSPYLQQDATAGEASFPDDDEWPRNDEIVEALTRYKNAIMDAQMKREAVELLKRERQPRSGLYASAAWIDEEVPMLIEGLIREHGVSVIFGDFDELKTTLMLDMMAHVAMGAPWQGRKVKPRPVIWYALEGAEEVPLRMRALEAQIREKNPAWGDDRAPVTVLDRIPEDYRKWRAELSRAGQRWSEVYYARSQMGELPTERDADGYTGARYPDPNPTETLPVVVIDTLSMALAGEDERGPRAAGFINDCIDLLKKRPDMATPFYMNEEDEAEWLTEHPGETLFMDYPVASHVIIIHHQTKTGTDFAGHRAIAANTQGLYRIHRHGRMADTVRPLSGQLTPQRVKGIPRPAPIRFEAEAVSVEGTKQTALILKDKAPALPKDLKPIITALRELDDREAVTLTDMNECLDVVAAKGSKDGAAKRKARQRYRDKLEAAGVIEPVEDDNGKVTAYLFHDVEGV